MWNEKCYRQSHLQSRSGNTGIENKYTDSQGGRRGGMNWEVTAQTPLCVEQVTDENILSRAGNTPQRVPLSKEEGISVYTGLIWFAVE